MKRMMGLNLFTQAGLGQTQREFETGPFRTQLSDFKATTSRGATTDPAALGRPWSVGMDFSRLGLDFGIAFCDFFGKLWNNLLAGKL